MFVHPVFYLVEIAGQNIGCYTMDKVGLRKWFELDRAFHITTSVWLPDWTTPLLAFILASKILCPLPQSDKLWMQSVDSNWSVQFHATCFMNIAFFKSEQFNISSVFLPVYRITLTLQNFESVHCYRCTKKSCIQTTRKDSFAHKIQDVSDAWLQFKRWHNCIADMCTKWDHALKLQYFSGSSFDKLTRKKTEGNFLHIASTKMDRTNTTLR